jgi:hypothetical protein
MAKGGGLLLPASLQALLMALLAALLQNLLDSAGVAQLLQRQSDDHQDLLPAQL